MSKGQITDIQYGYEGPENQHGDYLIKNDFPVGMGIASFYPYFESCSDISLVIHN